MNLDELQRLAEGATPSPWKAGHRTVTAPETDERLPLDVRLYGGNSDDHKRNAKYIAAMSPDTAKKLIAVAKREEVLRAAAQAVLDRRNSPRWEWHKQGPTADLMAALRTALEELK